MRFERRPPAAATVLGPKVVSHPFDIVAFWMKDCAFDTRYSSLPRQILSCPVHSSAPPARTSGFLVAASPVARRHPRGLVEEPVHIQSPSRTTRSSSPSLLFRTPRRFRVLLA